MISLKVTARNRLPELRRQLRPRAARAINAWARNTFAISQQLVNVDTGHLKDSGEIVDYANTVGDARQRGVAKAIAYTADYALYVHDGTAHLSGNPFLLAAFLATRQQLIDQLNEIFQLN